MVESIVCVLKMCNSYLCQHDSVNENLINHQLSLITIRHSVMQVVSHSLAALSDQQTKHRSVQTTSDVYLYSIRPMGDHRVNSPWRRNSSVVLRWHRHDLTWSDPTENRAVCNCTQCLNCREFGGWTSSLHQLPQLFVVLGDWRSDKAPTI